LRAFSDGDYVAGGGNCNDDDGTEGGSDVVVVHEEEDAQLVQRGQKLNMDSI
jgi:hypothetical protein